MSDEKRQAAAESPQAPSVRDAASKREESVATRLAFRAKWERLREASSQPERERLIHKLRNELWATNTHQSHAGQLRPIQVAAALVEIDALRAQLAEAEAKALAYDLTHTGDWLERAHAVAQKNPAANAGRDVWHICVEQAEKLAEAEARLARLRPVVKAAVNHSHEDKCPNCCQDWPPGTPCSGCEFNESKASLTDADRAWALGSEQEGRSDG